MLETYICANIIQFILETNFYFIFSLCTIHSIWSHGHYILHMRMEISSSLILLNRYIFQAKECMLLQLLCRLNYKMKRTRTIISFFSSAPTPVAACTWATFCRATKPTFRWSWTRQCVVQPDIYSSIKSSQQCGCWYFFIVSQIFVELVVQLDLHCNYRRYN